MAKHPKFQAADVAREKTIPKAFNLFGCKIPGLRLSKIEPKPKRFPRLGPLPMPTFQVKDENDRIWAYFHPYGDYECYEPSFQDVFDKMRRFINKSGEDALKNYIQMNKLTN